MRRVTWETVRGESAEWLLRGSYREADLEVLQTGVAPIDAALVFDPSGELVAGQDVLAALLVGGSFAVPVVRGCNPCERVEWIEPTRLRVDHAFAARRERPLDELRAEVRESGVVAPLVVTRDRLVLDGHGRLSVALDLGLDEIPIVRLPIDAEATWEETVALAFKLRREHFSEGQRRAVSRACAAHGVARPDFMRRRFGGAA